MNSLITRKSCPLGHAVYRSAVVRNVRRLGVENAWVRCSSNTPDQDEPQIRKTRNIGIIAHIDAV
jgi:hypothetical protein